jgi:hypothetical protein
MWKCPVGKSKNPLSYSSLVFIIAVEQANVETPNNEEGSNACA